MLELASAAESCSDPEAGGELARVPLPLGFCIPQDCSSRGRGRSSSPLYIGRSSI